jgi:hypothetical protein
MQGQVQMVSLSQKSNKHQAEANTLVSFKQPAVAAPTPCINRQILIMSYSF